MEYPCTSCIHRNRHKEKCLQAPNTCLLLVKYQRQLDKQNGLPNDTTKNYSIDMTYSVNLNSGIRTKLPNM
jgi:hypothetical protein